MSDALAFDEISAEQSQSQHEQQQHDLPDPDRQELQVNHHQEVIEWFSGTWIVPVSFPNQGSHDLTQNSHSICGVSIANDISQNGNQGAISTLQEFLQCSKDFRSPIKRSILQWRYDEMMLSTSSPAFRAIVAFLLDGVPHHTAGEWKPSKGLAKRDAAERALQLFVGGWGEELLQWMQGSEQRLEELVGLHQGSGEAIQAVEILEKYCGSKGYGLPSWHITWDGNKCKALAEIRLMDVPHHFVGDAWENEENAYASTAGRILFYLKCPGFEDFIEFNPAAPAANQSEIPAPPTNWIDPAEQETAQVAEGKTVRLQSRLRRIFGKQLKPGQSVWEWGGYETDNGCPPNFRISLYIPSVDKRFTGFWKHDQNQAEIDTCGHVAKFLDEYEGTRKNKSQQWLRARH